MKPLPFYFQPFLGMPLFALLIGGGTLLGQATDPGTPYPRILRTIPAGATIGATTTLSLHGMDLEAPKEFLTTHPGLKAKLVLEEAQKKDPKAAPPPNPKIELTVDASVPVGMHGVRVINSWGTSNLCLIPIHRLAQGVEKEPNNDLAEATNLPWKSWMTGTISGSTDVDYYSVEVPANSPLVVFCQVGAINSGAQPRIELISPTGKPLRMNHSHRVNDALICWRSTAAGKYKIRVSELAYNRGDEGAQYQLYAGPGPWVETPTPLVMGKSKNQPITLTGFGLDPAKPGKGFGGESVSLVTQPSQFRSLTYFGRPERCPKGEYFSLEPALPSGSPVEPLFVETTDLVVVTEKESNNTPETAQEVPLGADITGRMDKAGDVDYYRFNGKKGQKVEAVLLPLSQGGFHQGHLRILALAGDKKIAASKEDDANFAYPKFFQKGLDVSLDFTLPADGPYAIAVGSRVSTSLHGTSSGYRLRIGEPKPAITVYGISPLSQNPGSIPIARGGTEAVLIYVQRTNGFNGEVKISPERLPPGIRVAPITLPPGIQVANLSITAEDNAAEGQSPLRLVAESTLGKSEPVYLSMRTTLPAAAITLPHMGVDSEMMVSVRGTTPFVLKGAVDKPVLKVGEKAEFKVDLVRKGPDKTVIAVQGLESPGNLLGTAPVNINADKTEVKIPVTVPDSVPLGTYLLSVRGQSPIPFAKDPAAKTKPPANMVVWSNPVTVEIIPKDLGSVQATATGDPLKPGKPGQLTVKITRREGFTGEVKLTLLEKGDGKIKVEAGTIPAAKDSVVLKLDIAADVGLGAKSNLALQAEGPWKGKFPLTQKIPLNLTIVK